MCIILVGEYHFPSQTPCEDNKDFALLRFHGGPPYEVIDTHIQCTCTYIHILGDLQADYMFMYTYMYISVVMCGDLAVDLWHISKYMYNIACKSCMVNFGKSLAGIVTEKWVYSSLSCYTWQNAIVLWSMCMSSDFFDKYVAFSSLTSSLLLSCRTLPSRLSTGSGSIHGSMASRASSTTISCSCGSGSRETDIGDSDGVNNVAPVEIAATCACNAYILFCHSLTVYCILHEL